MLQRGNSKYCHDLASLLNSPCDSANSEVSMVMQISSARTTAMRKPKTPAAKLLQAGLRRQGITPDTWDREQAGIVIRRDRIGS